MRGWLSPRRPGLVLAALAALLYAPTLHFGIVLLDDNVFLVDRLAYLRDWSNLPEVWSRSSFLESAGGFYYRPVLITSFMLDAALGGGSLPVFHLTNLLIHAAACVLLHSVLSRLLPAGRAFPLAALFAAHPVLASAVAWVPARTESLLAALLLASFRFYLDFAASGRPRDLLAHSACLALALLTKELAVVLPAACLLHAVLLGGKSPDRRRLLALGACWLLLLGGWKLARALFLDNPQGYALRSTVNSVYANLPALLLYLSKLAFPVGLSPYPILPDASLAPGLLVLLGLAAGVGLSGKADLRLPALGAGWFLLFLLPSFVYPPNAIQPVFYEYRAYLPLAGLLVFLGSLDRLWPPRPALWSALLVLSAAGALYNSRHYKDAPAFWTRAVEYSPRSAFARKQLGTVFHFMGRPGPAEAEYLQSLALNPREPMVHNNLGVVYMNAGLFDRAELEFRRELSLFPGDERALSNLDLLAKKRKGGTPYIFPRKGGTP